jgi:hypothetical protein
MVIAPEGSLEATIPPISPRTRLEDSRNEYSCAKLMRLILVIDYTAPGFFGAKRDVQPSPRKTYDKSF